MQENYLAKWLDGTLSEEELTAFKKSGTYASYERLKAVSSTLRRPEFDVEQALDRLKQEHVGNAPNDVALHPYNRFLRIAATITTLIIGSYFYLNHAKRSFTTDLAERTEIVLPDTSEVLLNAESKISFDEGDWNRNRKVDLNNGEAFFKVAKGKKFTVSTPQGNVTVLGTQFNVENRDGFFEVTCYEGLVKVSHKNLERQLTAGTSFLVVDGKMVDTPTLKASQPSWVDDESSFERIPLKFVLEELERQYNIKVRTENVDTGLFFTGTFSNKNLNLALRSIRGCFEIYHLNLFIITLVMAK